MGLSGAKKRVKLSHDPNNTAWSRDTTGFGHKILAAQGWKPGEFLGAENANHADHYTAANASHIRVVLREDNLGLGAQIGKGNAETFGLSMFSGLLGRLNGKSDGELESQRKAQLDAQIRIQHEQKYGFLNFISGGFLIGDKIEPKTTSGLAAPETSGGSKKRKLGSEDETSASRTAASQASTGAVDQPAELSNAEEKALSSSSETDGAAKKRSKKDRRRDKRSKERPEAQSERAREKAEKRARKEERRKRKEGKRAQKSSDSSQEDVRPPMPGPAARLPIVSNGNRHATRQRYIQQKRMASMDPKALKEIFMLQAST